MQPTERIIHHEIPGKPWAVIGTDMFTMYNEKYLCIVDYHIKFPIIKKMYEFLVESLILACKIVFAECI